MNKAPAHLAFSLPPTGQRLIEASAGTGKTWTISTFIVRMLCAAPTTALNAPNIHNINSKHIIVTTFTRAAAAELKSKIVARLYAIEPYISRASFAEATQHAHENELALYILNSWGEKHFAQCQHQLADVLVSIDDLFVGTLDSVWQKLLTEFSFDSTTSKPRQISAHQHDVLVQLTATIVRRELSTIPSVILDALFHLNLLGAHLDFYTRIANNVLNDFSIPIEIQKAVQIDVAHITNACQTLVHFSDEHWNSYRKQLQRETMNQRKIPPWQTFIYYVQQAQENSHSLLYRLPSKMALQLQTRTPDIFNKSADATYQQDFWEQPQTQALIALATLHVQLPLVADALYARIAVSVRQQFAHHLSRMGTTTFTLQTQLLLDSIQANPSLAQQIGWRYPVIIVDEFQDTNEQQNQLLQAVHAASTHPQRALIMVGDPKQAIYQFRGADVHAYLRIKARLPHSQHYNLTTNYRSSPNLIAALNQFFLTHPTFEHGINYQPIDAATAAAAQLPKHGFAEQAPMRFISVPPDSTPTDQVCQQLIAFLQTAKDDQLLVDHHNITLTDIAILAEKQKDLDSIEMTLNKHRIPVFRRTGHSVFASPVAYELLILMQTLHAPHHTTLRRRLQAGRLFNYSLSSLTCMDSHLDEQWIKTLDHGFTQWSSYHFNDAWRILNHHFSAWDSLQGHDLIDLRQLLALIHQANQSRPPHELLAWLQQKINQSTDTKTISEEEQVQRQQLSEGVQLMTIHTSKGLEFPIVFMLGVTPPSTRNTTPIFWRPLGPTGARSVFKRFTATDKPILQALHTSEKLRLLYVAMTRAKLRLAIIHHTDNDILEHWLNSDAWQALARTQQQLAYLEEADTRDYSHWQYRCATSEAVNINSTQLEYIGRHLSVWTQTSFSALTRTAHDLPIDTIDEQSILRLPDGSPALPISFDASDSDNNQIDTLDLLADDTRFSFPKGAHSGSCLHQILEYIHPTNTEDWQRTFDKQLGAFGIHIPDTKLMLNWFHDIMHTPLIHDFALAHIEQSQRIRELDFSLSIAKDQLNAKALQSLFLKQQIMLPKLNTPEYARFLNGAIDLTFVHQGKYYIADYKNSYLGATLDDYRPEQLAIHMHTSCYFLQAAIYQLALHRLLKYRLVEYHPAKHLGGALYLYLRGMKHQSGTTYGVYHWQPTPDFIEQLDQLLG